MVDEGLVQDIARYIILGETEDIEYLTMWEVTSDRPEVENYTDEELQDLVDAVDDLCGRAEVEVRFP